MSKAAIGNDGCFPFFGGDVPVWCLSQAMRLEGTMYEQRRLYSRGGHALLPWVIALVAGLLVSVLAQVAAAQVTCPSVPLGANQTMAALYREHGLQDKGVNYKSQFLKWNEHLGDPSALQAGTLICIGPPGSTDAVAPATVPSTAPVANVPEAADASVGAAHEVASSPQATDDCPKGFVPGQVIVGQTYFSIAVKAGITVDQLLAANQRNLGQVLLAGELLCMPGERQQPAVGTAPPSLNKSSSEDGKLDCGLLAYFGQLPATLGWRTRASYHVCPNFDPFQMYLALHYVGTYEQFLREPDLPLQVPPGTIIHMSTEGENGTGDVSFGADYGGWFGPEFGQFFRDTPHEPKDGSFTWQGSIAEVILSGANIPETAKGEQYLEVVAMITSYITRSYRDELIRQGWDIQIGSQDVAMPFIEALASGQTVREVLARAEVATRKLFEYDYRMRLVMRLPDSEVWQVQNDWRNSAHLGATGDFGLWGWIGDESYYHAGQGNAHLTPYIIREVFGDMRRQVMDGVTTPEQYFRDRLRNGAYDDFVESARQRWREDHPETGGTNAQAMPDEGTSNSCPDFAACDGTVSPSSSTCGNVIAACADGWTPPSLDSDCAKGVAAACAGEATPKLGDSSCAEAFGYANCADPLFQPAEGCNGMSVDSEAIATCGGPANGLGHKCYTDSYIKVPCGGGVWKEKLNPAESFSPMKPWEPVPSSQLAPAKPTPVGL